MVGDDLYSKRNRQIKISPDSETLHLNSHDHGILSRSNSRYSMTSPISPSNIRHHKKSCRVFYFVSFSIGVILFLSSFPLKLILRLSSKTSLNVNEPQFDISDQLPNSFSLPGKFQGDTIVENCTALVRLFLHPNLSKEEYEAADRLLLMCEQEALKQKSKNASIFDIRLVPENDGEGLESGDSTVIDKKKQNIIKVAQQLANQYKYSDNIQKAAEIDFSQQKMKYSNENDKLYHLEKDLQQQLNNTQRENHFYREQPNISLGNPVSFKKGVENININSDKKTRNQQNPLFQLRREMLQQFGTWYGCDSDPTINSMKGKDLRMSLAPVKKGFLRSRQSISNKTVEITEEKSKDEEFKIVDNDSINLDGHSGNDIDLDQSGNESVFEQVLNFQTLMGFLQNHGISSSPLPPYRFGLLFMINRELRHPKLWTRWLNNAYLWSKDLYEKREGPYSAIRDGEPFVPLFSLHVHFMGQGGGLYSSLKNVWRKWGLIAVEDSLKEAVNDPRLKLPQIFQDAIIPAVHCGWGDLNPCEHQLLKYGMKDPNSNGFAFISESTVPVKPFAFIYNEYQRNPRSRFFFSNVNLPLVRKHHQWIVLNRQHAGILVDHPEKWTCNNWMVHHYPHWHVIGNFAASDEYLPFYAISDIIGIDTIMLEVNSGKGQNLRIFNNTFQVHGDRNFRHTWLCWWELPDYIDSEPCGIIGEYSIRLSSPVTYYKIFAQKFQNLIIQNRNAWFARKFEKDCIVQLETSTQSLPEPQLKSELSQPETQVPQPKYRLSQSNDPEIKRPLDQDELNQDSLQPTSNTNRIQNSDQILLINHNVPTSNTTNSTALNPVSSQQSNRQQGQSVSIPTPAFSDFGTLGIVFPFIADTNNSVDIISLEDWLIDILLDDQENREGFESLPLHIYDQDVGK